MHSISLTYDDLVRTSDICHVQPLWVCSVPVTYLGHGWMYNAYARHMPGICRVVYAWVAYAWRVAHDCHMPIVRYLYALHMKYATYMPGLYEVISGINPAYSLLMLYAMYMPNIYMPDIYMAYESIWHMQGICQISYMQDIWHYYMPDTCLAYTWHITYARHMPDVAAPAAQPQI